MEWKLGEIRSVEGDLYQCVLEKEVNTCWGCSLFIDDICQKKTRKVW